MGNLHPWDDCPWNDCPRVFEVWDNVRGVGKVAIQTYRFRDGEVPGLVHVPESEQFGWMSREDWQRFTGHLARQEPPTSYAALLRDAHRNVLRLEARPHYQIPAERDMLEAFHEERPQPELPASAIAALDRMRQETVGGKRRQRVRVVDDPLTDYERWELVHAYPWNLEAGEEILIVERGVESLHHDFYLIDGRVAVLVHYDDEGRLLSGWRTDDPDVVHPCRKLYETALARAEPLQRYLERTGLAAVVNG
jgi:hypothetical protein